MELTINQLFQSLFYWITYSYAITIAWGVRLTNGFNPYFIGLPILIAIIDTFDIRYNDVSILILLDYLFLSLNFRPKGYNPDGFNPYFIGLPILIRSVEKALYLLLLQNFFQTLKSSFFRFF